MIISLTKTFQVLKSENIKSAKIDKILEELDKEIKTQQESRMKKTKHRIQEESKHNKKEEKKTGHKRSAEKETERK